jgi:hypothetical protein
MTAIASCTHARNILFEKFEKPAVSRFSRIDVR